MLAADHSRLPPALIVTAELDPLRDEGRRYAEALANCGTPVTYQCEKGMIHGFVGMTGVVDRARMVSTRMATSLRRALSGM
ncbi:MAG: alpha/beta hydrolase fold domain-containing protein [Gammaproteobacteria bacterium]|nr:alpha/beta hydrolase fold domain-containing protein [Gammaproteobacteria bacterium]